MFSSSALAGDFCGETHTGNPNGDGLPEWPEYCPSVKPRLYLDKEIRPEPLTDIQIERYEYFSTFSVEDLMKGLEPSGG